MKRGPHFDKLRQHLLYLFIKNKDFNSFQLLLNALSNFSSQQ
ncbi:hypothetical protein PRO82_000534 [Candidatus Protochlamydia amoebophila]|nr:hypothetical protein [Candidatus Protochlamydia amoebophila]